MSSSQDPAVGPAPVAFGPLLARSSHFKALFEDGMSLVEDAASYLDGTGRSEAQVLPPVLAEAYSAEAMRLTSRLMQMASWLLIRRAVVDGEMSDAEASQSRVKITFTPQRRASAQAIFLQLPLRLQTLTERSLRLQERVSHLDRMIADGTDATPTPTAPGFAEQYARLKSAFGGTD